MPTRHVGGGPGLVDEDEALGIEVELTVEPGFTALQDVGPVLFGSVRGLFFARDRVTLEEALDRAEPEHQAVVLAQDRAHLVDRSIAIRTERREDRRSMRVDTMRFLIAAHRLGPGVARVRVRERATG